MVLHFDSLFSPALPLPRWDNPPLLFALVEKDIFKVKNLQDEVHLTKESILQS